MRKQENQKIIVLKAKSKSERTVISPLCTYQPQGTCYKSEHR